MDESNSFALCLALRRRPMSLGIKDAAILEGFENQTISLMEKSIKP